MDALFFFLFRILGGCILEVNLVKTMRQPEQHVNFVESEEYNLDNCIYLSLGLLLFSLMLLWKTI